MKEKKKLSGIKSWPEDNRPREKLLKKGAGVLSNSELLAILLRTGTTGTSAIDLARKILKKFSTFRNMAHTDARDWKEFKCLGGAKIAHIQAALFLTMPSSFKGKIVQYAGRLHRYHHDKHDIRIYDYVDSQLTVLERMFKRRSKTYRLLGYEISDQAGTGGQ